MFGLCSPEPHALQQDRIEGGQKPHFDDRERNESRERAGSDTIGDHSGPLENDTIVIGWQLDQQSKFEARRLDDGVDRFRRHAHVGSWPARLA